jgi:uncharacterized protein
MSNININAVVNQYVAVWNEPSAEARKRSVAQLWRSDAEHVLQSREVTGHAAIEARVTSAYDDLCVAKGFAFSLAGGADEGIQSHHDAVTFDVNMTPHSGDAIAWIGRIILLLDDKGKIRRDYQFGRFVAG